MGDKKELYFSFCDAVGVSVSLDDILFGISINTFSTGILIEIGFGIVTINIGIHKNQEKEKSDD